MRVCVCVCVRAYDKSPTFRSLVMIQDSKIDILNLSCRGMDE